MAMSRISKGGAMYKQLLSQLLIFAKPTANQTSLGIPRRRNNPGPTYTLLCTPAYTCTFAENVAILGNIDHLNILIFIN